MALALALGGAAQAQSVQLAGRMGERALLVVDGQTQMLAVGQTVAGIRLLRWVDDSAEIESGGRPQRLRVGGTPAQVGAPPAPGRGREIVITAGPGGHFTTAGLVNGRPVRFMVDTGATLVALGRDDAQRLGLDLAAARPLLMQTANGAVQGHLVTLSSVRVGDVELSNVGAVVLPMAMPVLLLGNSFLARLQMRRDNDVMRLELK